MIKQPSMFWVGFWMIAETISAGIFAAFTVGVFAWGLLGCDDTRASGDYFGLPTGASAFTYCDHQCNTPTLKLISVELGGQAGHDTILCHCEVRPESMTGSNPFQRAMHSVPQTLRVPRTFTYDQKTGEYYVSSSECIPAESRLDGGVVEGVIATGITDSPKVPAIDDFTFENFKLEGYDPHPAIKGEVAV